MGSTTKVVPTTSNTQQTVELPEYLKQAGQSAVNKATAISNTPFPKYNGELVAGLSGNQNAAIGKAAQDVNAGQGALGVANTALGAAGGAAAAGSGAGTGALNGASTLFGQQGGQALTSMDAGKASGDLAASLAGTAGSQAQGAQTSGNADLDQARSYNAASAAPISGTDIDRYFNPYVQQALDPVIAQLQKTAGQNSVALASKAGLGGSFGGGRYGLEQAQNNADLLSQIAATSGKGYSDAFNTALAAAQNQQTAANRAANTAIATSGQANTNSNSAIDRLTQAADAAGRAGTVQSTLANDSTNRLGAAGTNMLNLGKTQSDLSTADVQRFLSLIAPANQNATTESQLSNDALNRLLTTGNLEQTQRQNEDNAGYQQFQNEYVNWPQQQLNALLAAAGGVPYGTSTTSNTQGTQVVQQPSMLGQLVGAGAAIAGAMSDRDSKENFADVDGEDILASFRNLSIETYNYKPEVAAEIGDDGRTRIGPMSQDFGREFLGDPEAKIIPMPEALGVLFGAVQALERRTAPAPRRAPRHRHIGALAA